MSELQKLLDMYCEQYHFKTEGRRGVDSLCKLASALGYSDPMKFGQRDHNVVIGDLIYMLEDNSGMIEAMVEWIGSRHCPEWKESLAGMTKEYEFPEEDDEVEHE